MKRVRAIINDKVLKNDPRDKMSLNKEFLELDKDDVVLDLFSCFINV